MLRDTLKRAEKAKKKPAALGEDVDIEEFEQEEEGEHEKIESLQELPNKYQETLLKVGVDPTEQGRAGSFMQIDQSGVCSNCSSESIELMNIKDAAEKYSWLSDYMWKAVAVDADKYTAETELRSSNGYFIRALPGSREVFPIQACMFIGDKDVAQTAHNIIIAEENAELHIITGCSTGSDVSSAMHVGVSEFYLKKGAKITFTMVHNWAEQVEVRPRTGIIMGDDSTYISNYILTSPVRTIQTYPTAYCQGENSRAVFQSILGGQKNSILDQGSRAYLTGRNSSSEMVTRAVSKDKSQIYTRGHLAGKSQEVKGHLECMGLVLSDDSMIYSVPELEGSATNLELSHEAAVGKIAEEEVLYLMSRGLTEDEAASMIVRGFLSMDITGLPPELAAETKRMLDMSVKGM
ncbi:SufB/SufD family protein [Methanobacterium paludis]|uniref:SufBD protein n=1 Tax=Methanobacterium paludis (strain DSM 25820 / JCM 18151 / SWAN1) TaxID=868131 RepID=F6D2B9_METPW|nr:SufD family Fe-S cluster assembly protein [Methanobacterium paludis]AEG19051.1 SufBD protein [Methanobacterium paludis]